MWWRCQKTGRSHPRDLSKPVGSIHQKEGYLRFGFNNERYLAHVVCWVLYYGEWPKKHLDHIDGNTLNNRKNNLREVSGSENKHNQQKLYKSNTSGVHGVRFISSRNKWQARLSVNNVRIFGGEFDSIEDAITSRKNLEESYNVAKHSLLTKKLENKRQYETMNQLSEYETPFQNISL